MSLLSTSSLPLCPVPGGSCCMSSSLLSIQLLCCVPAVSATSLVGCSLFVMAWQSDGTRMGVVCKGSPSLFFAVSRAIIEYFLQCGMPLLSCSHKEAAVASLFPLYLSLATFPHVVPVTGLLSVFAPLGCLELASVRTSLFRRKGKTPYLTCKAGRRPWLRKIFAHKIHGRMTVIFC